MSPSDTPVAEVLDRVPEPHRSEYSYTYESGHGGRAPVLAFASTSRHRTIYLGCDADVEHPELAQRLGSHRSSRACLYLSRLTKIDMAVLRKLLEASRAQTLRAWG